MKTYASIEEYAEHIRQETTRIMGASLAGCNSQAGMMAAALCTEAAGIVQGNKMRQEQEGDYDLSMLKVNIGASTDSENPYEDE